MCVWGGEQESCRLGSREGNSERKWASIKLCQGQFAVNGPLHLAAGGPQSSACWDGGPVHSEDRDKSITIIIHIIAPVLSCKSPMAEVMPSGATSSPLRRRFRSSA